MRKRYVLLSALIGLALVLVGVASALPVIPGAKGFGTETKAGRGGTVHKVTNLNPSGSGSLKACIDASGQRVCVFEVSGTIDVTSSLKINNPYITIAGQTAPSPGITVAGEMVIATHDVLVQHIRIRRGSGGECHAINFVGGTYNTVVDHCSLSWGTDENIGSWSSVHDITVANSFITEALHCSTHPKGCHSMGFLIGDDIKKVAVLGNLFAHNNDRHPRPKGGTETVIVNNLVYNMGSRGVFIGRDGSSRTLSSVVGNVYLSGPDTIASKPIGIDTPKNDGSRLFVSDNMLDGTVPNDPWDLVKIDTSEDIKASSAPLWVDGLSALPANQVKELVLGNAGARPADRDSVDNRIVNDVVKGTGGIIDSQNEVGGWPELAENRRVLTLPENPKGDDDGDGYTNLEEWLHSHLCEVEGPGSDSCIMSCILGDLNCDGKVDIFDLVLVAQNFGKSDGDPNWNPKADPNKDGRVDIFDLVLVAQNFGKTG